MRTISEIDQAVLQLELAFRIDRQIKIETQSDTSSFRMPQNAIPPTPFMDANQDLDRPAFAADVAMVLAGARSALKWARGDAEEWNFAAMLVELSDNFERLAELAATGTIVE